MGRKTMSKFICAFLLTWILARGLSAQEDRSWDDWHRQQVEEVVAPALDLTSHLTAYIAYAQLYNPSIEAALARWGSALGKVAPARSWADPRLSVGHFARSVETRVGPQEQRLGLMQAIPWFDELDLRARAAQANAEMERWRYEGIRRDVAFQVQEAYFDYYYLERALAVTEENMQLGAYLEEVVRMRYRGGADLHGALIKVQIELGRIEDQLFSLRDQLYPTAARLNAVLGRPLSAPIAVVDSPLVVALDEEQLRAELSVNNPHLRVLRTAITRAELSREIGEKEGRPDLALGVDYIRTGEGVAGAKDSGKDPLVFMATLSLPLWREKYRAEVRSASEQVNAARAELRDRENRLMAELEQALFQWRASARKTALYRYNLLPKAEQSFNVTQQSFAAGRSAFLDLVDAQRVLLQFQLAYEKARSDGARHAAAVERLAGQLLPSRSEIEMEFFHAEQ
jgi:outer membrane protein, heavy metal efflux system